MIGAKRTAAVLRSGGTAALVYGQASMGVGNTMLHAQRSAVALASVPNGTVDVDIALVLADGGPAGHVDPAFAAHDAPICSWAAAVWNSWLPRLALARVCAAAAAWLADCPRPWARVRGHAAAFLSSVRRLGWVVKYFAEVVTDDATVILFTRGSPQVVRRAVWASVKRWRWRRVHGRHPHLLCQEGGLVVGRSFGYSTTAVVL